MSLARIQEARDSGVVLLVGNPGAGKTTFCHNIALRNMAIDRPLIMLTTEMSPRDTIKLLKDRGLKGAKELNLVDAFTQTVGLECKPLENSICADCSDLNSLSIAIKKMHNRIGKKDTLLIFDSLTSPYLFNGIEIVKFIRLFLSKFASEGNSVIATIDEGCGKKEDLGAIMSISDGVCKIELREGRHLLNVVKHPGFKPMEIEIPEYGAWEKKIWDLNLRNKDLLLKSTSNMLKGRAVTYLRKEIDNLVNPFWPNLTYWSGMLWEPEHFPETVYKSSKMDGAGIRNTINLLPWYTKLLLKLFIPKKFSRVKDMKKLLKMGRYLKQSGCGILEYLEDISKNDEHYIRVYESFECSSLKNVGAKLSYLITPTIAGICMGLEEEERDWNAVETKCVGLGDPYCEIKLVPKKIDKLKEPLNKESLVVIKIYERLMEVLLGHILEGKSLTERPKLGNNMSIEIAGAIMYLPIALGDRYQMAIRMGGVKTGKELGKRLLDAGLRSDEAIKKVMEFMDYCKVGKISIDETIKIKENCESLWSRAYKEKMDEPSCFFTTGFINGLFSVVKNKHVREIKCIATGDPYCEWEIV